MAADPFVPQPYRVARRAARDGRTSATLEIVPLAGERPAFKPGQFNMLYVVRRRRSGDQHERRSGATRAGFVHTVRDVGAVSGAIARLEAGAMLGLRGPFGIGLADRASAEGSDVVFVAGGLGLAPLRPAIYECWRSASATAAWCCCMARAAPRDILYRRSSSDGAGASMSISR